MESLLKVPKTKRGEKTLNAIIQSSKVLFGKKGFFDTTVQDIMKDANLATGTFYIYFHDKNGAYEYCLLDIQKQIRKTISIATEPLTSRYEIEYVGLKTYLDFIKSNKYAYRLIWQSQYINFDLFKNYYMSFGDRYVKQIIKAQANNEIKKDIDPEVVAYSLMGISNFIGLRYHVFEDVENNDTVVDDVINMLKNGLFN